MAQKEVKVPAGQIVISGLSAEDGKDRGTQVKGKIVSHEVSEPIVGKKDPSKTYVLVRGRMKTEAGLLLPVDLSAFAGGKYDDTASYMAVKTIRTDIEGKSYHSYVVMP